MLAIVNIAVTHTDTIQTKGDSESSVKEAHRRLGGLWTAGDGACLL